MRVISICADAFIGENLRVHIEQIGGHDIVALGADGSQVDLANLLEDADAIICQVNVAQRAEAPVGVCDTDALFDAINEIAARGRRPALIYVSSGHAEDEAAETVAEMRLRSLAADHGLPAHAWRLPHIFGKWCPPDNGSIVAGFCHDVSRGQPVRIDDPGAVVRLVYVDDVATAVLGALFGTASPEQASASRAIPEYHATIGDIAGLIETFRDGRRTLVVERVGAGLTRALYSTYLSYLDPADFSYPITAHGDPRGTFAEMLRTRDSGQISFFTAGPGITRGGHYHHTKTEKFLVIKGKARFRFRHIVTGQRYELAVDDANLRIVETVPGWTHDITNVGDGEMLVMLWANEQFDPAHPDTYALAL